MMSCSINLDVFPVYGNEYGVCFETYDLTNVLCNSNVCNMRFKDIFLSLNHKSIRNLSNYLLQIWIHLCQKFFNHWISTFKSTRQEKDLQIIHLLSLNCEWRISHPLSRILTSPLRCILQLRNIAKQLIMSKNLGQPLILSKM